VLDNENGEGYRATIRFAPIDGLTNTLVIDRQVEDMTAQAYKLEAVAPNGISNALFGVGAELAALQGRPFHTTTSNAGDLPPQRVRAWTVSNVAAAELGGVTLKSISGYRDIDATISFDLDGSSKSILEGLDRSRAWQISQELQFFGKALDDRLDYIGGVFFFNEQGSAFNPTSVFGTVSNYEIDVNNSSYSLFGQVGYRVLPQVTITAGGRNTWDKRQMTSFQTVAGACHLFTADIGGVPLNPCERTVNKNFEAFTYNLSIDWKITPSLLVYAGHRKGYRAGGFATTASLPSEFIPFRPETIKDFEVGLKADWRVGGVSGRTNIAAYTGDYRDIQRNLTTQLRDPQNPNVFVNLSPILNAARATIKGFEIEQVLTPSDLFNISVSYAYSDPKYKDFILNGADFTDAPFAGAPKHVLSGSLQVNIPLDEEIGSISAQLDASYRSHTITADVSSYDPVTKTVLQGAVLPSYTLINARVDWRSVMGTKVTLSLFAQNLADKNYTPSGQNIAALGLTTRILGAPRIVGLEARYEF
jgi:iron complex outermembrane receptor protein